MNAVIIKSCICSGFSACMVYIWYILLKSPRNLFVRYPKVFLGSNKLILYPELPKTGH